MKALAIGGLLAIVAVLAFIVPHIFIWSLNELFEVGVAHDLGNWFAALVLLVIFGSTGSRGRSKQ